MAPHREVFVRGRKTIGSAIIKGQVVVWDNQKHILVAQLLFNNIPK